MINGLWAAVLWIPIRIQDPGFWGLLMIRIQAQDQKNLAMKIPGPDLRSSGVYLAIFSFEIQNFNYFRPLKLLILDGYIKHSKCRLKNEIHYKYFINIKRPKNSKNEMK